MHQSQPPTPVVHIHYHSETFTADLSGIFQRLNEMEKAMSTQLDRLTREVAETRGVVDSAVTALAGIAQQIRENLDDREALTVLADDLDAQQGTLAAAIASVPSGTTPLPQPEPAPADPLAVPDTTF